MPDKNNSASVYSFRLYISGEAPNSRTARANLNKIKSQLPENEFNVEIIDVCETPQEALDHGIFVTPALQMIKPEPGLLVYGDLSDLSALGSFLPKVKS